MVGFELMVKGAKDKVKGVRLEQRFHFLELFCHGEDFCFDAA